MPSKAEHPTADVAAPPPAPTTRRSVVARQYRPRDYYGRRALALADLTGLLGALVITGLVVLDAPLGSYLLAGAPVVLLALPIFRGYRLYDRDAQRVAHSTLDDVPALFHGLLVFGLVQWGWFRLLSDADLGVEPLVLAHVALLAALSMALILGARTAARALLAARFGPEQVLLIGDAGPIPALVRKMRGHPEYELEPVGLVTARTRTGAPTELPVLGNVGEIDLEALIERRRIDRVVLSHIDLDNAAMLELVSSCKSLGVKVSILPEIFDALGPSTEIDEVEGMTLLAVHAPVLSRSSRALKRALDVSGAAFGLLAMTPLFLALALAIRLDSRGPVFFRQIRVGVGDELFGVLKFRTMIADAEARRDELLALSRDPNWLDLEHDPRITRVGRVLRHLSLDELPQLWNVLRGEMSLVGPRPLPVTEDRNVGGRGRHRLDLKPGMTGLWQVLGRTRIPFDEMVKLDYLYVTNWSLWRDVRLLLRTAGVVLLRRGVN
jgi:exopolysaccharide biosynthesis polyprenyl glycosylphosphotransferase